MQKILVWGSVLLGAILVLVAVVYFITPAGNLPHVLPGFMEGSAKIHYKHGIASLLLGIALFVLAWFKSAPNYPKAEASENADENTD